MLCIGVMKKEKYRKKKKKEVYLKKPTMYTKVNLPMKV